MQQHVSACDHCGQPVPAGAAFCPNCGAPAQAATSQSAPTQVASTPPESVGDNTPTKLVPPPAPEATLRANAAQASDPYASQYQAPPASASGPPPFSQYAVPGASGPYPNSQTPVAAPPAPPGYAPGPPPAMTPGGVAPWAQPQKGSGRRFAFGCIAAIILVVLLLGGGGVLAFKLLASGKSSHSSSQHAGSTPGATSGTGSTPGSSSTQTLNNINRQAVYAGVMITVVSASEAQQMPDFQNFQSDQDAILRIAASIDEEFTRHGGFLFHARVMAPGGNPIEVGLGHGIPRDRMPDELGDPTRLTGAFYFEVPKAVKITDWTLMIGDDTEVQVTIPLGGNFDPTLYQEISHTMGLNQPIRYDNGNITGVITKIVTVTWNPCGCEAPKGMRFLRVYFHVTNNTSAPVFVGDGTYPQYLLIFPNGDRLQADTQYNAHIDATVAGKESKDVGFDSWVIPAASAPYTMVFLNPDGTKAGQIDLGTV